MPNRPDEWTVHNLIGHPAREILRMLGLERAGDWLHDRTIPDDPDPWQHPVPRFYMWEIWWALGGNIDQFDEWMSDPNRTPADAWAQLLAAIRGDLMENDHNPEPGVILGLIWQREVTGG